MIYHELFGQHLRLGNFLFKYAWSIAMKEKYGIETTYPEYYLWKYLQNPPLTSFPLSGEMLRPRKWEYSLEEEWFVEDFVKRQESIGQHTEVALNFFFQSENWFKDYKEQVYDSLEFKQEEIQKVKQKYSYIFGSDKPTIGISIRLGDFIGHGDFYQIPASWYILALNKHFPDWKEEYNVVIFSDDIEHAKRIFAGYEYDSFFYANPNGTQTHADNFKYYHGDAGEQLILGSLMDNFIIGNSTFSWWISWLATYNHGKVVHSGKVFSETGNMKHVDTKDYYPQSWIKFELE